LFLEFLRLWHNANSRLPPFIRGRNQEMSCRLSKEAQANMGFLAGFRMAGFGCDEMRELGMAVAVVGRKPPHVRQNSSRAERAGNYLQLPSLLG